MDEYTEEEIQMCGWSRGQHIAHGVILGLAAGAVGYFVGKKWTERKYEDILATLEVAYDEQTQELYEDIVEDEGYNLPDVEGEALRPDDLPQAEVDILTQEAVREEIEALEEFEANGVTQHEPLEPAIQIVKEDPDPSWDWDKELPAREELTAYVIHEDEFMYNESGFEQISLTYFAEDSVLVDDQDQPIPAVDPVIGEGTLQRFGDGCGDENTVFARNERLSVEYEITRDPGSYRDMFLGLQHSDGGPRSRRRANEPRKAKGDWQ